MSIVLAKDFLAAHPGEIFVKCLNADFIHHGQQLTVGENISPRFSDSLNCDGLHFTTVSHVHEWLPDYSGPVAYVTFPEGAKVEECNFKADRIILSEPLPREIFALRHIGSNISLSSFALQSTALADLPLEARRMLWNMLVNFSHRTNCTCYKSDGNVCLQCRYGVTTNDRYCQISPSLASSIRSALPCQIISAPLPSFPPNVSSGISSIRSLSIGRI